MGQSPKFITMSLLIKVFKDAKKAERERERERESVLSTTNKILFKEDRNEKYPVHCYQFPLFTSIFVLKILFILNLTNVLH